MRALSDKLDMKKNEIMFYGFPSPNFSTSHHEPYNSLLNISEAVLPNDTN